MEKRLKIAVDAMGGDHAPEEIIKGAVEAAKTLGVEIILVGTKDTISAGLAKTDVSGLPVSVVDAPDIIKDGEEPAFAVMRKPKSSIALAATMVKKGEVDAMVSAGSTGAIMVAGLQYVGVMPGIDRPMMGGAFLQLAPKTIVLDLGANVGCQPYHLVDFAVAGTVYARTFLGIDNPTVGLLNVGSEEGKGTDLTKEAYAMLKKSGLNFTGNVEGMDIPFSRANVIVCDGFVGNVLVKFCEGLGRVVNKWLGTELKGKMPDSAIDEVGGKLYRLLSPGAAVGGGPMWGVNGVVVKAHGSSRAAQIAGAIGQARQAVESGFVPQLAGELEKVKGKISAG
jgi:glycerol-3-phosphate acyltransferase PlsX